MANVTQQITNYIGGVTRIPDFNKIPGQVRDIVNGYPDLTYGLLKRPGTEYIERIGDINGLEDRYQCHVIDRAGDPKFLVFVGDPFVGGEYIYIYNLDTGARVDIDYSRAGARAYMDYVPGRNDLDRSNYIDLVSDDRRTVIVNRSLRVGASPTATHGFKWADTNDAGRFQLNGYVRTVGNIGALPDSSAQALKFDTSDWYGEGTPVDTLREGWHILATTNNDNNKGAGLTIRCYIKDNGFISQSPDKTPEIVSAGFNYYDGQVVQINGVDGGRVRVITGLRCGYVYHVTGPTGNGENTDKKDDYFMMPFSSRADLKDSFYYVEVCAADARKSLNRDTLPHELIYERDEGKFYYQQIDYSDRWVGNNVTNPDPSFVGEYIESAFFYNNRLGFLAADNVILSRPIEYTDDDWKDVEDIIIPDGNPFARRNPREIDFFLQSAIQQNASDPIDLSASNNKVASFVKAISTPQGIVLFGGGQQSLLSSTEGGPMTPATANITNLAVYECDANVKPVAMDSDYYFIDQSNRSARLQRLTTNFDSSPATVVDVTTQVQDWIPTNLKEMNTSQASSFIMLSRPDRDHVYIYKRVDDYESWFKWQLPHNVKYIYAKNDTIYFITISGSKTFYISKMDTFLLPNSEVMEGYPDNMSAALTPYLDYNFIPSAAQMTATEDELIVDVSASLYPDITDNRTLTLVTAAVSLTPRNSYSISALSSGAVVDGTYTTAGGRKLRFPGDFRAEAAAQQIIIGYRYDFNVEFPTFYFQNQNGADYTAYLTIARAKYALSLSGEFEFQVKSPYADWTTATSSVESFTDANYYLADSAPLDFQRISTVPIHQRNTNFLLRLHSDSPFPLALDSCMWEGNYSPRYYRRN